MPNGVLESSMLPGTKCIFTRIVSEPDTLSANRIVAPYGSLQPLQPVYHPEFRYFHVFEHQLAVSIPPSGYNDKDVRWGYHYLSAVSKVGLQTFPYQDFFPGDNSVPSSHRCGWRKLKRKRSPFKATVSSDLITLSAPSTDELSVLPD